MAEPGAWYSKPGLLPPAVTAAPNCHRCRPDTPATGNNPCHREVTIASVDAFLPKCGIDTDLLPRETEPKGSGVEKGSYYVY